MSDRQRIRQGTTPARPGFTVDPQSSPGVIPTEHQVAASIAHPPDTGPSMVPSPPPNQDSPIPSPPQMDSAPPVANEASDGSALSPPGFPDMPEFPDLPEFPDMPDLPDFPDVAFDTLETVAAAPGHPEIADLYVVDVPDLPLPMAESLMPAPHLPVAPTPAAASDLKAKIGTHVNAYRGELMAPPVHSICNVAMRALDYDEMVPAIAHFSVLQDGEVAVIRLSARRASDDVSDLVQEQLSLVQSSRPIEEPGRIKTLLGPWVRFAMESLAYMVHPDAGRRGRPTSPWAAPEPIKPKSRHEISEREAKAMEFARDKVSASNGAYYETRLHVMSLGTPGRQEELDGVCRRVIEEIGASYQNTGSGQGFQFTPCDPFEAAAGLMPVEPTRRALLCPHEMGELMHVPDSLTSPASVSIKRGKRVKWPDNPIVIPDIINPPAGVIPFGLINVGTSREQAIGMPIEGLKTHMYLCGTTGSGKSTIMENFIYGLARDDRCVFVVDPHGPLADNSIEAILAFYPEAADRIQLLDFGDRDWPVSFNPLAISSVEEIEGTVTAVGEMILKMLNLDKNSAPRAVTYIEQTVWALCEANLGGLNGHRHLALSLLQVTEFLQNQQFRALCMQFVTNPQVIATFGPEGSFEKIGERSQQDHVQPILRTFASLGTKDSFSNIFSQSENKIDFSKWVHENKLVFMKLPTIASDASVATFIGAMVTPMLIGSLTSWGHNPNLAAFLMIDEFQNYATESYKHLLAQTRKHGLHGISANQIPNDLPADVLRGVQSNTQTKITMRLDQQAVKLISDFIASGEKYPRPEDIVSLDNYWGWANIMMGGGKASGPFVFKGLAPSYDTTRRNPRTAHLMDEAERNYKRLLPQVTESSRLSSALPRDEVFARRTTHLRDAMRVLEQKVRDRARRGHYDQPSAGLIDDARNRQRDY